MAQPHAAAGIARTCTTTARRVTFLGLRKTVDNGLMIVGAALERADTAFTAVFAAELCVNLYANLVRRFFGRCFADLRLCPRAEPERQMRAKLDAAISARILQRLRIGVGDNELHAL